MLMLMLLFPHTTYSPDTIGCASCGLRVAFDDQLHCIVFEQTNTHNFHTDRDEAVRVR